MALGSGGVGASHATATLSRALVFVQAAPGAVLLRPGHGVVQAFKPYRASSANLLGLALPDVPRRLAPTTRTEKEQQVRATARYSILPTPVRAGKHSRLPTYLRHGSITSTKMHQIVRYSGSQALEHANQPLFGNLRCKIQRVFVTRCSRTRLRRPQKQAVTIPNGCRRRFGSPVLLTDAQAAVSPSTMMPFVVDVPHAGWLNCPT